MFFKNTNFMDLPFGCGVREHEPKVAQVNLTNSTNSRSRKLKPCGVHAFSHADAADLRRTMQRDYTFFIREYAEAYIASLVCCRPDG